MGQGLAKELTFADIVTVAMKDGLGEVLVVQESMKENLKHPSVLHLSADLNGKTTLVNVSRTKVAIDRIPMGLS